MIATLGVLVLVLFIIFIVLLYQKRMLANKDQIRENENKHQKALLQAALEIAERERQQIAKDIHDDIGLNLANLKINISMIGRQKTPGEEADLTKASFSLIDGIIGSVRHIYANIFPPTLMRSGFVAGIAELCRQIGRSGAIQIDFSSEQSKIEFEVRQQLELYRLLKEVLNNTLKHARPSHIEISIKKSENNLIVIILHNGLGITTEQIRSFSQSSGGLGLKSILTRAALLPAEIDYRIIDPEKAQVTINTQLA
jgi:two-component system, NarL family, sensor kinase